MTRVLLLWDLCEYGLEVFRLVGISDSDFNDLLNIDGHYCNGSLPLEHHPAWDRVHALLTANTDHVEAEHRSIAGKWREFLWRNASDPLSDSHGEARLHGKWTLIQSGMVP